MNDVPRLIATDLDGTVLRSDHTSSPHTRAVLAELSRRGVTIVGATGRGPRLLGLSRADVPSADFLVLAQGGFVYDCTREIAVQLTSTLIPGKHAAKAVTIVEAEVGPVRLVVENDVGDSTPLVGDVLDNWPFPVPIHQLERGVALAGDIVKAFMFSETVPAPLLLDRGSGIVPPELCALTDAGVGYVEICPPGVHKARGLALVAKRLGVAPGEVMVFGDATNDLSMFAWAGHAVAVANALPPVRRAADEVTLSNDADGVAVYLERLFGL
ncbi:MAG TPA: HAD family hydrolase [Stackebrandtia sp.]|jgi:hydroxymethylpyrimidine pyrophosphatase-like HAD family hydrolase|uniref:HAD family hydrolase n=1 Tax=Stackebrandtia sp. TaxID=2023065 RepID=UPI002D4541FF|nr:HAD family hydrolase [Stackebrandtia sp.]HZE38719.1 HAD family hydrolase [Stackebrandtia sp.]